ncbi:T9SS type A sorting domain-containing protein [Fluviicola taffensis]|uniref:Secretion system C-terminal sorting domain-containing protein n=1 Tax=Fluviicola taffensis (strain DSM 16823 / NCIMB 13979 / RW262) TaxID=755732 RepID=F2IDG1_FLUTR|nr:T9SS type A sorting domain-containing protein [Fluviicola taffensis]AEA42337.1 hypothetical protein Fluta_0328 [Fluviicola taffensis DSM 16823]
MKIIFTLFTISFCIVAFGQKQTNSTTKNSGCSVLQETGNLNTGFPSDFDQYQGLDDFFVPANECWSIDQIKAAFFLNVPSNSLGFEFNVFEDSPFSPGDLISYSYSYVDVTDYTATPIETFTTGFLAGYTEYELDFDLVETLDLCGGSTGKTYWISIYSSNLDASTTTIWEVDTIQVDNYGLNAQLMDVNSGNFINTTPGVDFVFELNYRMFSEQNETSCNSYTWIDGNEYTANTFHQEYVVPGGAVNGCDSVVFLNLIIKNSGTSIDTHNACTSFIWIDGNTYTSSNNTAQFIINNASLNGCDSIVKLNLTINPSVSATITENVIGTLEATTGTGYQYQWINCTTNQVISNETSSTYQATENGSYAVIITNATNCKDTSSCFTVAQLGIQDNSLSNVKIYPNPTTGKLFFDGLTTMNASIEVYDLNGKLLLTQENTSSKGSISLEMLDGNIFIVKIHENGMTTQQKVVMM